MKSYGRAPTFLMAAGYEQVRSIAAALAGDREAAERVELVLPETGVCSTDLGSVDGDEGGCDTPDCADSGDSGTDADSVCCPPVSACCAPEVPVSLGIPTGTAHGRSGQRSHA